MLAVFLPAAEAHKVSAVSVVTEIDTDKRTCKVELAMEVEPTGDPAIDDLITPEQAATTFATEALIVYFDDEPIDAGEPDIRTVDESDEATPEDLRRKKVVATVMREIPAEAENFLLYVDENTEAAVVMVVIKDEKPARRLQVLYPGEFSNPVNVKPVADGDPSTKGEAADEEGTGPLSGEADGEPKPAESEPATPETESTPAGQGAVAQTGAGAESETAEPTASRIALYGLVALFVIAAIFVVVFVMNRATDSKSDEEL